MSEREAPIRPSLSETDTALVVKALHAWGQVLIYADAGEERVFEVIDLVREIESGRLQPSQSAPVVGSGELWEILEELLRHLWDSPGQWEPGKLEAYEARVRTRLAELVPVPFS